MYLRANQPDNPLPHKRSNKLLPIYVQGAECVKTLNNALNDVAKENFELMALRNDEIRIQSSDSVHYRTIINMLRINDTKYYTFKPKDERGFRVVLRNMHHSTDIEVNVLLTREEGSQSNKHTQHPSKKYKKTTPPILC